MMVMVMVILSRMNMTSMIEEVVTRAEQEVDMKRCTGLCESRCGETGV